jgi:iron complex transport system permease protein
MSALRGTALALTLYLFSLVLPMRNLLFWLVAVVLSLAMLSVGASGATLGGLLDFSGSSQAGQIVWQLRAPRVLVGFLVGASLTISGVVVQSLFRNPLACPYTLGVSSAAAFGAVMGIVFGLNLGAVSFWLPLAMALSASALLLLLWRRNVSVTQLLLTGLMLSFVFSSLSVLLQYLGDMSQVFRINRWLMGSLDGSPPKLLPWLAAIVCLQVTVVFRLHRELDLLALGLELARSRGLQDRLILTLLLATVSCSVAFVVALAGPIAFVGIIVPHISRQLARSNLHLQLLQVALPLGGLFLVLCDGLARTIVAPFEIPVGVITALIGAPIFLTLLLWRRGKWPGVSRSTEF